MDDADLAVQEMNLSALRRVDPTIDKILATSGHVTVYDFRDNAWQRKDVEGTLFVYERTASPYWGFYVMNRLHVDNVNQAIVKELEFHIEEGPFIFYRTSRGEIHGLWFYSDEDRQELSDLLHKLKSQCDNDEKPQAAAGAQLLQMLQQQQHQQQEQEPANADVAHLTDLFRRAAARSRTTSNSSDGPGAAADSAPAAMSGPLGALFAKALEKQPQPQLQPQPQPQPQPQHQHQHQQPSYAAAAATAPDVESASPVGSPGTNSPDANVLSGLLSKAFGAVTNGGSSTSAATVTQPPQPQQHQQQQSTSQHAAQRPIRTKHAHMLQAPGGIVPPQARPSTIQTGPARSASQTNLGDQPQAEQASSSSTSAAATQQKMAVRGALNTSLPPALKHIANEQLRHHQEKQSLMSPEDILSGAALQPPKALSKTQLQRALLQLFEKDSKLLDFVHENYLRLFSQMTSSAST